MGKPQTLDSDMGPTAPVFNRPVRPEPVNEVEERLQAPWPTMGFRMYLLGSLLGSVESFSLGLGFL